MLLVVDIGNTNIVWGVYDDRTLAAHWRLATDVKKTSDEYGILFANLLTAAGIPSHRLSGAIISSVVPALTGTVEDMLEQYFHQHPLVVTSDMDTGLTLRYANPKEIGSDRLVNAAAAYHKYRRDLIVVDFGTATTFCAITAEGHYLGGVIAPGLGISAEALFARAAKLAKVELIRPKTATAPTPPAVFNPACYSVMQDWSIPSSGEWNRNSDAPPMSSAPGDSVPSWQQKPLPFKKLNRS